MKDLWSTFFKNKGKFYILPHPDFSEVIKYFKEQEVYKVIDIGCGTGRHLIEMAEKGLDVTGIDFSPAAGQIAESWLNEQNLTGKVYVADFREELVSFQTDEFDAAVAIESLQYLDSTFQLEKIIAELNRIVKTDGFIFIVLPSDRSLILQPEVTQVYFDKPYLETAFSSCFEIIDFYEDEKKNWVIMAKNKKNLIAEFSKQDEKVTG
jgi:SAM-dependent methyltransferase